LSRNLKSSFVRNKGFLRLLNRIVFFNGKIFDFVASGKSIALKSISSRKYKWVSLIGRDYYFESVKDYPVGDRADLKNILKNEPWRFPYEGMRFTKIEALSDQSHRVTDWIIKQEVLDSFERKPLFLVPESACLDGLEYDWGIEVKRLGEVLQVNRTPNGVLSWVSGADSLGDDQQSSFSNLNASASSGQDNIVKLKGAEAIEEILLGLMAIMRLSPLRFFTGINLNVVTEYPWKSALRVSASIVVIYLALTSTYLMLANNWLNHQISLLGGQVESALDVRREISNKEEQSVMVTETFMAVKPTWLVWDMFLDLGNLGVTFRAVNGTNSDVTFFLTAPKASVVLDFLTQDERVIKAEYAVPIRKVGDKEQFAINITLKGEPVLSSDVKRTPYEGRDINLYSKSQALDYE
jgi:hypothetical protein